jgi:hypothetical protein
LCDHEQVKNAGTHWLHSWQSISYEVSLALIFFCLYVFILKHYLHRNRLLLFANHLAVLYFKSSFVSALLGVAFGRRDLQTLPDQTSFCGDFSKSLFE